MKTIHRITGVILVLLPLIIRAEGKEIPFTLDDRDRIIRTEQKVDALEQKVEALDQKMDSKVDELRSEMNARFEAVDQRFDQLFNFLWAIIGIFTIMMVSVFGFSLILRNAGLL